MTDDTIVALSSGALPAGIGVIRVSGRLAGRVLERLTGSVPHPRQAVLRRLRDDAGGLLDQALVLWFPGPATATGEDLAELHCHGGRAVIDAVVAAILETGCRRAEGGEFTRRALTNGRIDLAETEGLANLLAAETEQQRRAAIDLADGALGRAVRGWMDDLAIISALVEAEIDYDDEGDVAVAADEVRGRLTQVAASLGEAVRHPTTDRLRDGFRVVLAGSPNTGKSSLLNRLAGRDAAIVTPIAGTTRDVIEVPVAREGWPIILIDTAGLHETRDPVERIGVARARAAIEGADVLLWFDDAPPTRCDAIWLYPRADTRPSGPADRIAVSVENPQSIDLLWRAIIAALGPLLPRTSGALTIRHRDLVCASLREIEQAEKQTDPLLVAEHLRQARSALAAIVGVDATEAMLDQLFARFCVGK